jgi:hypothetical protein
MSGIRVNEWLHNSGTGGIWQTSAGNVGIASSVPTTKLEVTGDAKISGITTAETFVPTVGQLSHRNLITNGAFIINQRSSAITVNSGSNVYGADRWYGRGEGSKAVFTVTQTEHGSLQALGTKYSWKVAVTSHTSTVSGDVYKVAQRIEGQNIIPLALGTASAKAFTLSFLVRSNVTGTHSGSFMNSAQNRSYPFTYTVDASATWESKTITVPGDTSGTWLNTNGIGMELNFDVGSDAAKRAAAGSWHGSRAEGATGAVQVTETSGGYVEWAKVQLEVGSVATPFEHRGYGDELARCQRYYYRAIADTSDDFGSGFNSSTTQCRPTIVFPVTMRDAISAVETTGTASNYKVAHGGTETNCSSVPTYSGGSTINARCIFTVSSGLTAGNGSAGRSNAASAYLGFSAEL